MFSGISANIFLCLSNACFVNLPFGYFRFIFTNNTTKEFIKRQEKGQEKGQKQDRNSGLGQKSKAVIPVLHFKRVLRAETTFDDERFVDWFFVLRDNQGVAFPCHHDLICRRRCCFLRVVS